MGTLWDTRYFISYILAGTVCIQNGTHVDFVLSCSPADYLKYCPVGVTGDCKCSVQPKCINGIQRCKAECRCNEGYEECVLGEWKNRNLALSTVCSQNGTKIIEQFACPEFGYQGKCAGRTEGECYCQKDPTCITGNKRCIVECGCNKGYEECVHGFWKEMPMASK